MQFRVLRPSDVGGAVWAILPPDSFGMQNAKCAKFGSFNIKDQNRDNYVPAN